MHIEVIDVIGPKMKIKNCIDAEQKMNKKMIGEWRDGKMNEKLIGEGWGESWMKKWMKKWLGWMGEEDGDIYS